MKKVLLVISICLYAWATPVVAVEGYHTFTLSNGRMLAARILEYNPSNNQLQIERLDGEKAWVTPGVFDEKDHTYIREWIDASKILSAIRLQVTLEKIVHSHQEHSELFCYEIKLSNQTGGPLDDLKIEYKYFVDLTGGTIQVDDPKRVISGQLHVDHMDDHSWKRLRMATVRDFEEYPYQYNEKVYDNKGNQLLQPEPEMKGRCKVRGLWIRIHGPVVDGVPSYRDICEPENLVSSVKWNEERAPINVDFSFDKLKNAGPKKNVMSLDEVKQRGKASSSVEHWQWIEAASQQFQLELSSEELETLMSGIEFFYDQNLDTNGDGASRVGFNCVQKGMLTEAVHWYELSLEIADDRKASDIQQKLVRIYACAEDPSIRNGAKAVKYALLLLENDEKDRRLLDLMARAYAANDQFELAVKTQKYAIERYRKVAGSSRQAATSSELAELKNRLVLYQNGKLYIETNLKKL